MIRKFAFGIILAAFGLGASGTANAQAFEKGGTYLNLNFGGSHFNNIYVGGAKPGFGYPAAYNWWYSTAGGVNLQMEWGIHRYVGLGFTAGLMGGTYGWAPGWWGPANRFGVLSVPVGMIANFHFYQLIDDKSSRDIHADKLDIYAGLNIGSGFSIAPTPGWTSVLFFAGPQVGAKYYVTPGIALGGEVGYGKTFINGGVTFKL